MNHAFTAFTNVFPPHDGENVRCSAAFTDEVEGALGTRVPAQLRDFWREMGAGYFGDRELLFFGPAHSTCEGLVAWNRRDFWTDIASPAHEGGPVFFAENPFGEQLGFRWRGDQCEVILFIVDTMETFRVSEVQEFFGVLTSRDAVTDLKRLDDVRKLIGLQPPGMHYAPIVSPLVGGSSAATNFHLETPNVHFRTAIATWIAVRDLPEGTPISGLDVELS